MDCKICYEKFDKVRFKPVICVPCTHTFCSICVSQINECSICRSKISERKPNFSLLEILEDNYMVKTRVNTANGQTELSNSGLKLKTEDQTRKKEEKFRVNKNPNTMSKKIVSFKPSNPESKSNSNPEYVKLMNQGINLSNQKKFISALRKFNQSLKICHDDDWRSVLLFLKAQVLCDLNNFDQSIIFCNKALEYSHISSNEKKNIENCVAFCLMMQGVKLMKAQKFQDALNKYEKAIDFCSDNYKHKYLILWSKAKTLKATGNTNEAKLFYEFAIGIAPQEKIQEIKNEMK